MRTVNGMSLLRAHDLSFSYGARTVLDSVGLSVAPGDRIAVVGPNGVGKTTLLRLLSGDGEQDAGFVSATGTVGYLPQERDHRPGETVRGYLARRTGVAGAERALGETAQALAEESPGADEAYSEALDHYLALGGPDLDARAAALGAELGLPGDPDRETAGLSGGQGARLALAAVLLARFDVLLLDEPTNDLDLDGLDRLERHADALRGGLVVVSHDRAFLERTATQVLVLDPHSHRGVLYGGGYSAYAEELERDRRHAREEYETYAAERDELTERAGKRREWARTGQRAARTSGETDKSIRHHMAQTAQRTGAKAAAATRDLGRLDEVEEPRKEWELRLRFGAARRSGDVVARLSGAVVELGGDGRGGRDGGGNGCGGDTHGDRGGGVRDDGARDDGARDRAADADRGGDRDGRGDGGDRGGAGRSFRLGPVDLHLAWGDRVAVLGPNGSGKTTLVRALLGRVPLSAGTRTLGASVVAGEIDQARRTFDPGATLLDAFRARTGQGPADTRTLLAKFGLGAEHVTRTAGSLSPGERTRADLALLMQQGANLLVLDEPTNHLDLPAIEQLEQALGSYDGTLILVTHDRRLLERVSLTHRVRVDDGAVAVEQVSPRD